MLHVRLVPRLPCLLAACAKRIAIKTLSHPLVLATHNSKCCYQRSGRYPLHTGINNWLPNIAVGLPLDEVTMADLFTREGYRCDQTPACACWAHSGQTCCAPEAFAAPTTAAPTLSGSGIWASTTGSRHRCGFSPVANCGALLCTRERLDCRDSAREEYR